MPDDDNVSNGEPKVWMTYTCAGLALLVVFLTRIGFIEKSDALMYLGTLIPLAIAALRRGQKNDAKVVKQALVQQQEVVKTALVQAEAKECGDNQQYKTR